MASLDLKDFGRVLLSSDYRIYAFECICCKLLHTHFGKFIQHLKETPQIEKSEEVDRKPNIQEQEHIETFEWENTNNSLDEPAIDVVDFEGIDYLEDFGDNKDDKDVLMHDEESQDWNEDKESIDSNDIKDVTAMEEDIIIKVPRKKRMDNSIKKDQKFSFFHCEEDFIERFLNSFKSYDSLWKFPPNSVKRRAKRDEDYVKMASELGLEEHYTTRGVIYIKKYHNSMYNKIKKKPNSELSEKSLKYFKMLSFLDEGVEQELGLDNIQTVTKNVGNKETIIRCKECDITFDNKNRLQQHNRLKHRTDRFKCPYCPKRNDSKQDLEKHMRVHTNERPFVCSTCGKTYKNSSMLLFHARKHNDPTFLCSLCPKAFHSNYVLNAHMKMHLNTREYECPFCDRKFNKSKDLYFHKSRHHPEEWKKYCKYCRKFFDNLDEHCREQHGDLKLSKDNSQSD